MRWTRRRVVLAAGDWWLEQRPFPRERMVQTLADLLWGRLAAARERPTALPEPQPAPPAATEAATAEPADSQTQD